MSELDAASTASLGGAPQRRKWYCAMAVKGGCVREAVPPASGALDAAAASTASGSNESSASGSPEAGRPKKRRRTVDRRTKIFCSPNPPACLTELAGGEKDHDKVPFKIVAAMGPVDSESDAVKIERLWNFRSRGPTPRAFWGKIIADKLRLNMWMSVKDLLNFEALDVRQEESGKVYLVLPPNVAKELAKAQR